MSAVQIEIGCQDIRTVAFGAVSSRTVSTSAQSLQLACHIEMVVRDVVEVRHQGEVGLQRHLIILRIETPQVLVHRHGCLLAVADARDKGPRALHVVARREQARRCVINVIDVHLRPAAPCQLHA